MDTHTTKTTPNSENDQANTKQTDYQSKEFRIYPMPMDYDEIEHRSFMRMMERRKRREQAEANKKK